MDLLLHAKKVKNQNSLPYQVDSRLHSPQQTCVTKWV